MNTRINSSHPRYMGISGDCLNERATSPFSVRVFESDKIPLLAKATGIVSSLSREPLEESNLSICWLVAGSDIAISLNCPANDSRLKEQYRSDYELAVRISDILTQAEVRRSQGLTLLPGNGKGFELRITDEEIPSELKPFVCQAAAWHKFTARYSSALHLCTSVVNSEGVLLLFIKNYSLSIDDSRDLHTDQGEFFWFDPKTQPPVVDEEAVYWELFDEKVLVVLVHINSDVAIASRFGYLEVFAAQKRRQVELQQGAIRTLRLDSARKKLDAVEIKARVFHSLLTP